MQDVQSSTSTCISSPTTSTPIQSGMAVEESDEPPCSSSSIVDDPSTFSSTFNDITNDLKMNISHHPQSSSLTSPSSLISPKSPQSMSETRHDEQTLIMMITELDNEPTSDEDQHAMLKRKSDMGILELDLPSTLNNNNRQALKSPKSPDSNTKLSSVDELKVTVDELMDIASISASPIPCSPQTTKSTQESSRQQSPNNPGKEEEKQQQVQTDQKPADVQMDTEQQPSTSTQLSPIDTTNTVSTPKQLSPMDTSNQSPNKLPEICENLPPPPLPPIMPRNTNAEVQPPPRPIKPKVKRRPPNLPSIQSENIDLIQTRLFETLRLRVEQIRSLQFAPLAQHECTHTTSSSSKKGSTTCTAHVPLTSMLRLHVKVDGKEVFQSAPVLTHERFVLFTTSYYSIPNNKNTTPQKG